MKEKTFNKLAKKAGFVFWENESWKPKGATIDWSCDYTEELKKFAELVIKRESKKARSNRVFEESWSK